jgi:hypothetical protein
MTAARTAARASIIGTLLIASTSCGFPEMPSDAMALTDRYYAAIGASQFDAASTLYSPHFFETTSRDQLLGYWATIRERCGSPTSHKLVASTFLSEFGSDTIRANLAFDVTYERCHATEKMSIVKPAGSDSKIDVINAHVDRAEPISPTLSKPQSTTT